MGCRQSKSQSKSKNLEEYREKPQNASKTSIQKEICQKRSSTENIEDSNTQTQCGITQEQLRSNQHYSENGLAIGHNQVLKKLEQYKNKKESQEEE